MNWSAYPTGFAACAPLIVAIGAQNAFVLRQGLKNQHVLPIVVACVLADALLITIGVVGLGQVVEHHPGALQAARWLGGGFLVWYGVRAIWRARASQGLVAAGAAMPSLRATLGTLAALTFLNPHVYLDTVVLLGTIGCAQPLAGRMPFALGAVTASLSWFVLLGFGARLGARYLSSPRAWRRLDVGLGFTTLAMALGLLMG